MADPDLVIRPAENTAADLGFVDSCIRALAAEEGLPGVSASLGDLAAALFGPAPTVDALVAELGGRPVGFAVYHRKYSTVTGRRGLHLEDLYVVPDVRGHRIGAELLDHLQQLAGPRGMVDWWVLRSNEAAHHFYARNGAHELDAIAVFRRDSPDWGATPTGLAGG